MASIFLETRAGFDGGSALSKIRSFSAELFHHEEHEEKTVGFFSLKLRGLRGENWAAAGGAAPLRESFRSEHFQAEETLRSLIFPGRGILSGTPGEVPAEYVRFVLHLGSITYKMTGAARLFQQP